jgi:hypothetical protein
MVAKSPKREQSARTLIPEISAMQSPRQKYDLESSPSYFDNDTSVEIEERVQVAAKKFEVLQGNLTSFIEALEAQHKSIKTLDEDRLKVCNERCDENARLSFGLITFSSI